MHIWPKNWGWLNIKDIEGTLDSSIVKTNRYMERHFAVARKLNKPLVLEEFGLPRDHHGYSPDESTTCRNKYYQNAFSQILSHVKNNGVLEGCNIWTYAGIGRPLPGQIYWKRGDDLMGDPPCEEQGLNSVYDTDTLTVQLIKEYNLKIQNALQ